MRLHLRIYECLYCDHIEDRDTNSGYQIAFRNFLYDDENKYVQNKEQKKFTKNGVLYRRGMKLNAVMHQGDFQA